MKKTVFILAVAVIALFAVVTLQSQQAIGRSVERWEYHFLGFEEALGLGGYREQRQRLVETLNRLGSEGWELVGVSQFGVGTGLYFKRRLP